MLWKSLIFNLFIYFFFWNCFAILSLFLSKYIFFRLLSVLMKVYLIPHAIFEITRQGFIQILHHCSVSWKINRLYFSSSNLIYFIDRKSQLNWNLRLLGGWVKIHQILHVIFETKSQFFLNFVSLFSVMRDNSSVLF